MAQEYRHEKIKEKIEEKKKEEKEKTTEKKVEEKKKEKKVEVKKPKVSEVTAQGKYLPISFKHSVHIAKMIRGKNALKAKRLLEEVIALKRPVPFFRYNKEVPHKKGKGIDAGRYPRKAAYHILKVLMNAMANAKYLELDEKKLIVKEIIANRAVSKERGGKYTHLFIKLAEVKAK